MCFYKWALIYLNFIIVCSEDEIKGMLQELKSKVFFKAYREAFPKKDRHTIVAKIVLLVPGDILNIQIS